MANEAEKGMLAAERVLQYHQQIMVNAQRKEAVGTILLGSVQEGFH